MKATLYKGTFNYQREVHILYTHSASVLQAHKFFMRQLSKFHQCNIRHMMAYFDGSKDNYKIEIEKKKEVNHDYRRT